MTTQSHELESWLGDTQVTPEQFDRLLTEANDIGDRYPEEDDADDREAALIAATQYMLDGLTAEQAGQVRLASQIAARRALVTAQQIARMTILDGGSEAGTARAAGIDRMTARKLMGKR